MKNMLLTFSHLKTLRKSKYSGLFSRGKGSQCRASIMSLIQKRPIKGFTLTEILVSLLILSVGIVSILLFLTRSMSAINFANDTIVASSHGEYIFEEMRTRSSLANITGTNWTNFALTENLDTLPSEFINIYFPNPADDPLEIQATVEWSRDSRQNNVILTTEMTKW